MIIYEMDNYLIASSIVIDSENMLFEYLKLSEDFESIFQELSVERG
jgi:hypothetical protein